MNNSAEYFSSINQFELTSHILSTSQNLYLCIPSIHQEMADAILSLQSTTREDNKIVSIHLLIDYDAQTFRQGYGNHDAMKSLFDNQHIDIKNLSDNRISFIISDNKGYYLFIESRSLIPADKETINAVKIDPISIVRLKKYFFSSVQTSDFENELTNAIIEESQRLKEENNLAGNYTPSVREISKADKEKVSEDLDKNPPVNPDHKRIVEFYSTKFQYVKLTFKGSKVNRHKIELPPNALPFADEKLKKRIAARLNLFEADGTGDAFAGLDYLNETIDRMRDWFLTKIRSRDESLLDKRQKGEFEKAIEEFRANIKEVQNKNLSSISDLIDQTRLSLREELFTSFIENPKSLFPKDTDIQKLESKYIRSEASTQADKIIHRINWPGAFKLMAKCELGVQYSDITVENLKNVDFVDELIESQLINEAEIDELVKFGKGIMVR